LSEGINFGDDLGRCVVVLGLPYPNPADPTVSERMKYLDAHHHGETNGIREKKIDTDSIDTDRGLDPGQEVRRDRLGPATDEGSVPTLSGREWYEDMCLRALNQSIGRVIRHREDYAAVVLLDVRYTRYWGRGGEEFAGPLTKISSWMQPSFVRAERFGQVVQKVAAFFRDKLGPGVG
jgi:chromosome transmission fidelity protein 1